MTDMINRNNNSMSYDCMNNFSKNIVVANCFNKTTVITGIKNSGKEFLTTYIYNCLQNSFSYAFVLKTDNTNDELDKYIESIVVEHEELENMFIKFKDFCATNNDKNIFLCIKNCNNLQKSSMFSELMNLKNLTLVVQLQYPQILTNKKDTPYNVVLFKYNDEGCISKITSLFFPVNKEQELLNVFNSLTNYCFLFISGYNNTINKCLKVSENWFDDFKVIKQPFIENTNKLIKDKINQIEKLLLEIKLLL